MYWHIDKYGYEVFGFGMDMTGYTIGRDRSFTFLLLLLILNINAIALVQAGDIYRYQDAKGRWHFSDKKPDKEQAVETLDLSKRSTNINQSETDSPGLVIPDGLCDSDLQRRSLYYRPLGGFLGKDGNFKLIKKKQGDNLSLYAKNDFFAPISLNVRYLSHRGVESYPRMPLSIVIEPQSKKKVLEIKPVSNGWSYRYSTSWQVGDPKARHDQRCYYLPPVPPGRGYRVSQGFNGKFTHNTPYNRYAVDIAMPLGTPIVAVRDGVVIGRKTDFVLDGLTQAYKSRANSLWIKHGDGTIAIYAHLQFRTIKVFEGERVRAGQVVAKSGNTGYSTGPHLHFEIVSNRDQRWYTLPFQFYLEGRPVTPVWGMVLANLSLGDVKVAEKNQLKN